MSDTSTNRTILDALNDDVLLVVCDNVDGPSEYTEYAYYGETYTRPIKQLALVNKRFRALAAPYVFAYTGFTAKTWYRPERALKVMRASETITRNATGLNIAVHPSNHTCREDPDKDQSLTSEIVHDLVAVLQSLTRLRILHFRIPVEDLELVLPIFNAARVVLPRVERLYLSECTEVLVYSCPNAQHVSLVDHGDRFHRRENVCDDYAMRVVKAAQQSAGVRQLQMRVGPGGKLSNTIVEKLPNLQFLGLIGDTYGSTKSAIDKLSPLTELRTLALYDVSTLKMGLHIHTGHPFARKNRDFRERDDKMRAEAEEQVAAWVFAALPHLDTLWIGKWKFAKAQREDGKLTGWKWATPEEWKRLYGDSDWYGSIRVL